METTEATHQGVSRQEQDREALIAKRTEERKDDWTETENEEPEPEPELDPGLEAEGEEEPEKPEMMQFIDSDGNVYEVPASAAARLKIDGEEVDTPLETALRRYQKGAAGDRRLQEANNIQRELEAKRQDLTQREQHLLNQMQQAEEKKDQGNLSDDDYSTKVRDLVAALAEADEERAAELFPEVLPRKSQAEPEDMDSRVARKFREYQRQQDLERAQGDFYDNYSDLAEDTMLFEMVDNRTAKIAKENPELPPSKVITQAAEEVRQWRDEQVKKFAPKKKKKTSPTPASGRASIGEDEPPPQTRDDVLENMRKARGQPAKF